MRLGCPIQWPTAASHTEYPDCVPQQLWVSLGCPHMTAIDVHVCMSLPHIMPTQLIQRRDALRSPCMPRMRRCRSQASARPLGFRFS